MKKYEKMNTRKKATKKYNNASSLLDYTYKDIIFKKLINFEKENPTVFEDVVNDYFISLSNTYNRKNPEIESLKSSESFNSSDISISSITSPFYNFVEGQADLFSEEQVLFDESPSKAFKALAAGDEAYNYTAFKFGLNGHNDKSDAFRHATWNVWIIGYTNDYTWAYRWTLAHEIGGDRGSGLGGL